MAERYELIKKAYDVLDDCQEFDDSVILGGTIAGRALSRIIWNFSEEDRQKWIEAVFSDIRDDFNGKILVVSVGNGAIEIPVLSRLNLAEITCIDKKMNNMEIAHTRAELLGINNIRFIDCDITYTPFDNEMFDIVLSVNAFQAYDFKDAVYNECYRVLKKGGQFCGSMYVSGENDRTDKMIERTYIRKEKYIPPFETMETLRERLWKQYDVVSAKAEESVAVFRCIK